LPHALAAAALALSLVVQPAAPAQDPAPPAQDPAAAAAQPPPAQADPDVRIDPLQPDFTLAALPTTLRMPRGKWAFRVTHRFSRALGDGSFADLASDAFGFDGGAQIGLELRYGLLRGTQVGVHRTSDKSVQFFGQHNVLNPRDGAPIGLDALLTFEGADNAQEHHRAAIGAIVSRAAGRFASLYAEPIVVLNANPFEIGDDHTLLIGLGARVRVRPSWYLVGEITPRAAGFDPGAHQMSFGIEGRSGGHLFQINFSNGLGTTLGQLATGTLDYDRWYIGFNISRKFF
jgi:hypothetical protein